MTIRGSVDSISAEGASGWAFASGTGPARTLVIQALLDGRVIGETVADQHRSDLAEAGLGDGRCGFTMAFYDAPIERQLLPFISIRPRGGDVELPRTGLTGVGEYFGAIHARYPGAGRQRSVLGGLWTDRTDAARLLAGRVAIGSTPAGIREPLQRIIGDGYAVLRGVIDQPITGEGGFTLDGVTCNGPLAPHSAPADRQMLEITPSIVFQPPALALIQAMLDDTPVAHRVVFARGDGGTAGFSQASSAERLPSPAETVLVVACVGGVRSGHVLADIVAGSHELPEFTGDGRSRWLPDPVSNRPHPALEIARRFDASVRTVEVGPLDLLILGPGTVHRLRTPQEHTGALQVWCLPSRISPSRILECPEAGTFVVPHRSGAMLAV